MGWWAKQSKSAHVVDREYTILPSRENRHFLSRNCNEKAELYSKHGDSFHELRFVFRDAK